MNIEFDEFTKDLAQSATSRGRHKTSFSNKVFLYGAVLALGLPGESQVRAQSAVEAWVQRYDGSAIVVVAGGDTEKMVVDSAGNVIVAGFSPFENFTYDGLVIKYSGAGVPLWTNRYYGTGNAYYRSIAVGADGSGNVFVTGDLQGTNGAVYVTFKYSGAGMPLWTNLGPGGSANALAVDSSGKVVVTGFGTDSGGNAGYATIEYSGAGVPLWTNLYNNGYATATAVAVDSNSNAFVTGYVNGTNEPYDSVTIKYSEAGVPLWTNRQYGCYALALALDANGNAFVAGFLSRTNGSDFGTIKYSGAGVLLWTNRYNETGIDEAWVTALAVDRGGNAFVSGYSSGTSGTYSNSATIGYSSTGVPLWTNRYNGNSSNDRADAVAVDDSGNVFVTGYPTTIKYSAAGMPLWTNYGGGIAAALDDSGNVFVTGNGATTIAYSGAGGPSWTNRYIESAIGGDDHATSVAVDSNGNVFVTGDSYNGSSFDSVTIKYSGMGAALWTNRGPIGSASGLALDSNGNVFVTGFSDLVDRNYDYVTVKYSAAGVPLWTNLYNGPGNNEDRALALATDGSGNVFVTGSSYSLSGYVNYATIKYSGAGIPLWTNRVLSGGAGAVAVDSSGNVVVTGDSYDSGSKYDYVTIKYSAAGVPLWTTRYNGPGNYDDYAAGVVVDSSGNVLVTGSSYASNGYDYATIKYSRAGVPLWTNLYNGSGNRDDTATALAVDSNANVVVTGYSTITDVYPYLGYATIKYSSAGVPLWTNLYNAPGNGDGKATAVAVDGGGNVFVTGNSSGDGFFECATIKYSGAGVPLWTNRYPNASATALAVDGIGNVIVTGSSLASDGSSDYLTIKYSPAGVPLLTITRTTTNTVAVSWPSPSTGFTLQQNTNLATTNWSSINAAPADDGTTKTVIINPPGASKFYRLVHP